MKILVVGSKGFIGAACYGYLKKQDGISVFGADLNVDYTDPNYFLVDAINSNFKSIFKDISFDYCINCSGAASVPESFINPERDYLLNVNQIVKLLNAIKSEKSKCKLIHLSSAAVYGNPETLPINENHPLKPLSPYGLHKKQAEELCELYHLNYGISVYVLRIFSAYGVGLKKQLFWDLFKKSANTSELCLFGTGNETREFINIYDIVHAIHCIIKADKPNFQIINLANNDSVTIKSATHIFLDAMGLDVEVKFDGNCRIGDPLYWAAENNLLKNMNYVQSVSLKTGIKQYCKWLKEEE